VSTGHIAVDREWTVGHVRYGAHGHACAPASHIDSHSLPSSEHARCLALFFAAVNQVVSASISYGYRVVSADSRGI